MNTKSPIVMTALAVAGLMSLPACRGPGRSPATKPSKGLEHPIVEWTTIDSGGVMHARGDEYTISGTIGQPDVQRFTTAGHTVTGGFWTFKPGSEPVPTVRRPMPEDCGEVCIEATAPCTADTHCFGESRCIPPPSRETGGGVCYAPKLRYLSIVRHPEQLANTARRIRLQDEPWWVMWIGAPRWIEPTNQHDGLWVAHVSDTPAYEEIDFRGPWPSVLHVTGCEIAPGYTYEVQAIVQGEAIDVEANYSEALALNTNSTWGDVVSTCENICRPPDGAVDEVDCQAVIAKFQGRDVAPITWLDFAVPGGDQTPDQTVGVAETIACQGGPYPGLGPWLCP